MTNAQFNADIHFSTNAAQVARQIDDIVKKTTSLNRQAKFARALDTNKASARELTGQISGRRAIVKLEQDITKEAERRMKSIAKDYRFGNKQQNQYVRGLIHQNEVMRIQHKIMTDNATAMVNLGKNTQWAGRQLVVGFTVPLTIAAGAAMKAFSDLEKEMVRFKRVYGDVATSGTELKAMSKEVRNLANEWTKYGVAVSDTVTLAADAAGAGFKGDKLISQIDSATKLAVLGELEKQKAMKATIALQSTFKMSNAELGQSINYLNQLENSTMVTMDDMATAIPKAATVVQGLGGSIKDLGTFMAALQEGGVTAAEGANALKSGLGSLLNPSKAAVEQLSAIGVNMETLWDHSEKNGRGVISVVEELGAALDTLGQTQKQRVIEEVFGKHQFARMNALLSNINKGTQASQAKGVGAASQLESALIAQQELGKLGESTLTKFQSSVEKLKASIAPLGEQIMKFVTPLIEFATKIVEKFSNMPDVFKKIALGIVAGAGIIAPLFLMLLGQIQNLLGNGMKLIAWTKSWGKNVEWVAIENLTLADALGSVNAKLIAENALLTANAGAWKTRNTAAQAAGTAPLVTGRKSLGARLKRFASGGNVPGSGNSDTVPALLTPGEFVVRKGVASKFGNILHAMNSGTIQQHSDGTEYVMAHLTQPKKGMPNPNDFGYAHSRQLKSFESTVRGLGMDPKNFMSYVSNLTRPMPYAVNAGLNGGGVPANQLMQQFNSRRVNARNQPMAQALWSSGVDRKRINAGEFVGGQKEFDSVMRSMLRSRKSAPITDADLYKMVEKALTKMAISGKHPEFVGQLGRAASQTGQARPIKVSELSALASKANSKGAGITAWDLMQRDGGAKGGVKSDPLSASSRPFRSFGNSMWQKLTGFGKVKGMGLRRMATGGFVPGEGNKDTVPALLTPGEAVVKKSAAKQFAPILHAMNSGKLGMFGDGYTKGISKFGGTPLDATARIGFMEPFRAAIESIVAEMTATLKLNSKEAAKLRAQLERDYAAIPDASHVIRETDSDGNKIWRNENLVAASKQENVTMEAIAKSQQNIDVLGKSAQRLGLDMDKSRAVLQNVTEGEHLVDKQSRKLLKAMVEEQLQYEASNPNLTNSQKLTGGSLVGTKGAAFAGGLGVVPINYATGKPMTKKEIKALKSTSQGAGKAPTTFVDPGYDNNVKSGKGRFDPMAMMMMVSMFGGEISGATAKLGKFGDALNMALPALMTMQMMGMSPSLNMKGMIGKGNAAGKVGLAAKYAKFGLGAAAGFGAIGAIGGGLIGNQISDGKGGGRDVAGSAVSWGATGAGIGMMFGPLGAAIGGAVGALAGFTIATTKSAKEQERLTKEMANVAGRWETIGETLAKQFQIGGAEGMGGFLEGFSSSNKAQKELYVTMKEQMANDATWQKSITDIVTANQRGMLQSDQVKSEINTAVMQFRGQGVDEESIRTIVQAYIDSLPPEVRQGYDAATVKIDTTQGIISGLQASVNALTGELKTVTLSSNLNTYKSAAPYQGGTGFGMPMTGGLINAYVAQPNTKTTVTEFDPQEAGRLAGELVTAIASLNNSLVEAEKGSKEWDEAVKNLTAAQEANKTLQGKVKDEEARKAMGRAAGARVTNLIATNQGKGLVGPDWNKTIENFKGNSVDLAIAAEQLILAGYNIQGWSPDQMFAGAALAVQGAAYKEGYSKAQETLKQGEADLITLEKARQTRDDQLSSRSKEIKLDKKDVSLGKVEAKLEISRINIESAVLSKFVGQFNRAFGTSIDSFADAQYQIDKIGAKIQSIQLKVIGPIQEKADDLSRLNDLDSRKIDKLQKKAQAWDEAHQKRLDKLTKSYDEQAKALERVRQQNEYIANQQKANISLADALSKGDLAGAANAMVQSAQNQQNYAATLQDNQLADARDAALSKEQDKKNPYEGSIDKIQARIDARSQKILALEDRIYAITEKQIGPLQRKQDLMSLMLSNTQREMEYQKANADGIDQENQARERALINAQMANVEAQNRLTLEQNIRKEYRNAIKDIKERYGLESSNYAKIHAAIDTSNAKQKTSMDYLSTAISKNAENMAIVVRGGKEFDTFFAQNKPLLGSTADVLATAMELVRTGKVPEPKKAPKLTKEQYKANAKATNEGRYAGGHMDGSGGQDSIDAKLTPGEFVIRKSVAKKIGRSTLERLNMGDPNTMKNIDTGGATKFAVGGAVPNFLGTFGDIAGSEFSKNPVISDAIDSANASAAPYSPGGSSDYTSRPDSGWKPSAGAGRASLATAMERYLGATQIDGEAVARACARNVGKIWRKVVGTPTYAGTGTAAQVGKKVRDSGRMNSGVGPRGSVAYWNSSIGGGAGHVAINDGRGNTLNNWGGSRIERTPISSQKTGYMGWSNTFNKGGIVPGTGNSDKFPAWLTPGEMVLRKGAVNNIGRGPLKSLNETGRLSSNTVSLTPQRQAAPAAAGDIVYNYDVAFSISGVSDPNEVADIVIRKFERATKGKIRSR